MPKGRRPISDSQKAIAAHLHRQGLGPTAIADALAYWARKLPVEHWQEPATIWTIKKWVAEFKVVEDSSAGLDDPFEWHDHETHGLPTESSRWVLDMVAFLQTRWLVGGDDFPVGGSGGETMARMFGSLPPPTVREVRWWWRIHQAVPDLCSYDVWLLAWRFMLRELEREYLKRPMDMADLEALLVYTPWVSDTHLKSYGRATLTGYAKRPKHDPLADAINIHIYPSWDPEVRNLAPQAIIALMAVSLFDEPVRLPSAIHLQIEFSPEATALHEVSGRPRPAEGLSRYIETIDEALDEFIQKRTNEKNVRMIEMRMEMGQHE